MTSAMADCLVALKPSDRALLLSQVVDALLRQFRAEPDADLFKH